MVLATCYMYRYLKETGETDQNVSNEYTLPVLYMYTPCSKVLSQTTLLYTPCSKVLPQESLLDRYLQASVTSALTGPRSSSSCHLGIP